MVSLPVSDNVCEGRCYYSSSEDNNRRYEGESYSVIKQVKGEKMTPLPLSDNPREVLRNPITQVANQVITAMN